MQNQRKSNDLTLPHRCSMELRPTMTKKTQGNKLQTNKELYPRRISSLNGTDSNVERNSNHVSGGQATRAKSSINGSTCIVNCSIVASRGELARNNCTVRKTPASSIVNKKDKELVSASTRVKHQKSFLQEFSNEQDAAGFAGFKSQRQIRKSFSVPDCLREGFSTPQETGPIEESIFKKSYAFLTNLPYATNKIKERKFNNCPRGILSPTDYYSERTKYSTLKEYFPLSGNNDLGTFRRSPSVETLSVTRKKKSDARVKKSVSFSSDTSFEEKRASYRQAAVHEVKVYHKGVLQDRGAREFDIVTKVPSSCEATEGRLALLRAARDADESALKEIADQVRKIGIGDMDVNAADSSGRTAISYMAGNGATAMLELALSFERVDPNIPDNEGNTPLHFAAQAGQAECLNILLQRCPDIEIDARNASGFTPLMKAALQGRTKCAKILLFAGANPTLRDHGRGLRAEQWARFCGRYVCAEVIERFARHRLLERSTSCRWGSEPELAAKVLQGKVMPIPTTQPLLPQPSGLKSKIRRVFRTTSGPDRNFSLVSQLTSAALCASSPALPKSSDVPPVVKSLLRPLSVPQLRVTLVQQQDFLESKESFTDKIENVVGKPSRLKKKNK